MKVEFNNEPAGAKKGTMGMRMNEKEETRRKTVVLVEGEGERKQRGRRRDVGAVAFTFHMKL
jgi:hypothetical protein